MAKQYVVDLAKIVDGNEPEKVFDLGEQIAVGGFGKVYKARLIETGEVIAVKVLPLVDSGEDQTAEIKLEIEVMKESNHKNIIKFYGSFLKNDELYVAMEYCEAGALNEIYLDMERGFTEGQIAYIMKETLEGLSYLHDQGIIHRDIKGGNILLNSLGEIRVVDFGTCGRLTKAIKKRFSFVGTPYWMAPEVIDNSSTNVPYDEHVDTWSIGVTAIELAQCDPPLCNLHPYRALMTIASMTSPPTFDKPELYSHNFRDFVAQCLIRDSKKRPSCADLLAHPFLKECDKQSVQEVAHDLADIDLVIETTIDIEEFVTSMDAAIEEAEQYTHSEDSSSSVDESGRRSKEKRAKKLTKPESTPKRKSQERDSKEKKGRERSGSSVSNEKDGKGRRTSRDRERGSDKKRRPRSSSDKEGREGKEDGAKRGGREQLLDPKNEAARMRRTQRLTVMRTIEGSKKNEMLDKLRTNRRKSMARKNSEGKSNPATVGKAYMQFTWRDVVSTILNDPEEDGPKVDKALLSKQLKEMQKLKKKQITVEQKLKADQQNEIEQMKKTEANKRIAGKKAFLERAKARAKAKEREAQKVKTEWDGEVKKVKRAQEKERAALYETIAASEADKHRAFKRSNKDKEDEFKASIKGLNKNTDREKIAEMKSNYENISRYHQKVFENNLEEERYLQLGEQEIKHKAALAELHLRLIDLQGKAEAQDIQDEMAYELEDVRIAHRSNAELAKTRFQKGKNQAEKYNAMIKHHQKVRQNLEIEHLAKRQESEKKLCLREWKELRKAKENEQQQVLKKWKDQGMARESLIIEVEKLRKKLDNHEEKLMAKFKSGQEEERALLRTHHERVAKAATDRFQKRISGKSGKHTDENQDLKNSFEMELLDVRAKMEEVREGVIGRVKLRRLKEDRESHWKLLKLKLEHKLARLQRRIVHVKDLLVLAEKCPKDSAPIQDAKDQKKRVKQAEAQITALRRGLEDEREKHEAQLVKSVEALKDDTKRTKEFVRKENEDKRQRLINGDKDQVHHNRTRSAPKPSNKNPRDSPKKHRRHHAGAKSVDRGRDHVHGSPKPRTHRL